MSKQPKMILSYYSQVVSHANANFVGSVRVNGRVEVTTIVLPLQHPRIESSAIVMVSNCLIALIL